MDHVVKHALHALVRNNQTRRPVQLVHGAKDVQTVLLVETRRALVQDGERQLQHLVERQTERENHAIPLSAREGPDVASALRILSRRTPAFLNRVRARSTSSLLFSTRSTSRLRWSTRSLYRLYRSSSSICLLYSSHRSVSSCTRSSAVRRSASLTATRSPTPPNSCSTRRRSATRLW
jgi:hypothetical protein